MSSRFTCIAVPYAPALSDEDQELDPDRWCSHSAWGQECWQIISQWVPEPEAGTGARDRANASAHGLSFAPAISTPQAACHLNSLTHSHFCLWIWSTRHGYPPRKAGRFSGADFPHEGDGTRKSQSLPCASPKGAAKSALTGACAWCMREVTVTAALAHCANSVNGRATRRASQSPRECEARIRCRWVLHRCGFALLPPPSPSASL